MDIICLDLGTTTGFAQRVDGVVSSGSISFAQTRFDGGGMRYLKFRNWLDKALSDVDAVYFEEVRRHIGVDAAHAYGGFLATLTACCELYEIPYSGVGVGTIKKHITGKGNASKTDVLAAVKALGYNPKDDNEADAQALLEYVLKAKNL